MRNARCSDCGVYTRTKEMDFICSMGGCGGRADWVCLPCSRIRTWIARALVLGVFVFVALTLICG